MEDYDGVVFVEEAIKKHFSAEKWKLSMVSQKLLTRKISCDILETK
jgi:hypothetical protein